MNKLYNRILSKLADELIAQSYVEGYNLGIARGSNSSSNKVIHKLENFGIEKFNDKSLTLGFNTALELVKESK